MLPQIPDDPLLLARYGETLRVLAFDAPPETRKAKLEEALEPLKP